MEKVLTNRGKRGIKYNGFQYGLEKETSVSKLWRCVQKTCSARCKTDLQELMVLGGRYDHCHEEPNQRNIEKQKVRTEYKWKAEEELCERPCKLTIQEIEKQNLTEILPKDIRSIRQAVYRRRRKTQPKLPKSREETHEVVQEYELKSSNNEDMIYKNDIDTKIIMLTTKSNLRFLCQDVHLFADGTFQYCPKYFYQLYTIHAFKNGQYVPCVFFLLPDKTEETYRNMFQHLVECCIYLQLIPNISCLHLDFEHATHNAARAIWPGIDIKGCQFDLSQSWWKKVQSLGLAAEYINPASDVGNWIKSFFGLRKMAFKEHYHPQFKPSCKYTCK